jgi:hypothetical protein
MKDQQIISTLKNIEDSLLRLAPRDQKYFSGTDAFTSLNLRTILIHTSAVIAACDGLDSDNNAIDFVARWGIGGATLSPNFSFSVPAGWRITSLDLTSGTVIGYE